MKIYVHAPPHVLVQFNIYDHPADCPDAWVVRAWFILAGGGLVPNPLAWRFSDLESARAAIPDGMVMLARHPDDAPVLAEVWT